MVLYHWPDCRLAAHWTSADSLHGVLANAVRASIFHIQHHHHHRTVLCHRVFPQCLAQPPLGKVTATRARSLVLGCGESGSPATGQFCSEFLIRSTPVVGSPPAGSYTLLTYLGIMSEPLGEGEEGLPRYVYGVVYRVCKWALIDTYLGGRLSSRQYGIPRNCNVIINRSSNNWQH